MQDFLLLMPPVLAHLHNGVQAGLSQGKMLSNMATAVGGEGLTSLYWGYAPFLLKGLPYDVAELISYSQLTQYQERVPMLSALPVACRDCIIGETMSNLRCELALHPSYRESH